MPQGLCKEAAPNVFTREYSKATVTMDCARWKPTIKMKSDDQFNDTSAPAFKQLSCGPAAKQSVEQWRHQMDAFRTTMRSQSIAGGTPGSFCNSSDLYGQRAVEITQQHPVASGPLFIYLPWQAVHSPYDLVPGFDCETEYPPYPGVCKSLHTRSSPFVQKSARSKA